MTDFTPPDLPQTFCVNIEGSQYAWKEPTISTEQIIELGGWDQSLGVIEIRPDNSEVNLAPGQKVDLRPGLGIGFCRRIRWKRGFVRTEFINADIALLRRRYPGLIHKGEWVLIPNVKLPDGWTPNETSVVIQLPNTYPVTPPYGIYVRNELRFRGQPPRNSNPNLSNSPPFAGNWSILSWQVANSSDWRATADVETGANLCRWVDGAMTRFREGV